jgi:hypothetical protein
MNVLLRPRFVAIDTSLLNELARDMNAPKTNAGPLGSRAGVGEAQGPSLGLAQNEDMTALPAAARHHGSRTTRTVSDPTTL